MATSNAGGRRRTGLAGVWSAVAAAGLATFALSVAFYRLVVRFDEGTIVIGISGWHYTVALVAWSAVLAVAAVCGTGWMPATHGAVGRALGVVAVVLGLVAVVAVVLALGDRPTARDLAHSAVEHLDVEELRQTVAPSIGWSRRSSGVELGAGPYLLMLAASLSLLSGVLRSRAAFHGPG